MFTKDPKTQTAYRYTLNDFEAYLKKNGLEIVQDVETMEDIVQGFINEYSIGRAPNSVSVYCSRVKKYLKHLRISIEEVELPAKGHKDLYPVKLHEIHKIFSALKPHDVTLFLTQLAGGLRIGEALQLRKKHVTVRDGRVLLKIPSHIAKFKKSRTAVLTKECGARVMTHISDKADDDLVFGTSENVLYSESTKLSVLRSKIRKFGLDMKYEDTGRYMINSHSFRAYFITHVSRHDPNLAKKLSGQKGYMLQYDRMDDDALIDAFEQCEADLTIFDLAKKDEVFSKKQKETDKRLDMLEESNKKLQKTNEGLMRMLLEKSKSG